VVVERNGLGHAGEDFRQRRSGWREALLEPRISDLADPLQK
jgi:hypothetical protein